MNQPFRITNPYPPIPFRINAKNTLVYELFVHVDDHQSYVLNRIEILHDAAAGETIERWGEEKINANMRFLNQSYRPAEKDGLTPENIGLVFFWLSFDPGKALPAQLHHTLTLTDEKGHQRVEQVAVALQNRKPLVIQPPLRGKGWLAGEAASNTTGHRRTPLFIDGAPYFAQRYAVDWLQFGPDGKLFRDTPEKNENWYCYGADIHAVADGVVTEIQDGIIENVPLAEERAVAINLQSAPGNTIVIDHGEDNFATYAHMLPGSLTVKAGDRVRCAQVIGKLGNSGNSDAPHLHFHIGHRNSALGTHGVPYHLESFERIGNTGSSEQLMQLVMEGKAWQPQMEPEKRQNEYMLSNDVVNL